MDVAFGAVGVVGVAAQLFQSIVSVYQLLSTANGLSRDAPIALWKLKIQETRFIIWGRYWGVDAGDMDNFLEQNGIHDVVVGILRQTERLLNDLDSLKSKYKILSSQQAASVDQTMSASDGIGRKSTVDTMRGKWGAKIRWAISDKTKLEALIDDLKDFNDGLYNILRLNESIALGRIIQSDLLRRAPNQSETKYMQDACSETQDIAEHSAARTASLYKDIYTSAQAKLAHLNATDDERKVPSQRRPRASIEIPVERNRSEVRCQARFRHPEESDALSAICVTVEWKDFDPSSPVKMLIEQRLDGVAFLFSPEIQKPTDFRVLECLGYFEDGEFPRYGMIFRTPDANKGYPKTLYDLLINVDESTLPNLGDKFELARSLTTSILRLHDCGWIHGAFRSSNVLFFPLTDSEEDLQNFHFQDPYIVGFNYSRPSDPTESTLEYSMAHFEHDMYRHPQVAQFAARKALRSATDRQRFQIGHDLYSLGIVLLEIGLWRRVGTLWKDKYDHKRFLEKLIDAYVPRLGPKMGVIYRDVVKDLLSVKIDQVEKAKGDGMSQWYPLVMQNERQEAGPTESSATDLDGKSLEEEGAGYWQRESDLSSEVYWNVLQKLGRCCA
jgi:hypothetical protein